jgi:very-short-patch-repair endonuclease
MRQRVDQRKRQFARTMRSVATDAEMRLWYRLRDGRFGGLKFRRQVPIGGAIVDFACFEHHLVVEVDGGQHADSAEDRRRDDELGRRGFSVLRFWNNDVLADTDAVLAAIRDAASPNP